MTILKYSFLYRCEIMNFKAKDKKVPELSLQMFARIKRIFEDKQWPITNDFEENIFDDFCKMLTSLDAVESDLILNLTENFLWVQERDYLKYFAASFDKFINEYQFKELNKIYICPVLPEDDFGKSKSSVALLYSIKSYINSIQRKYNNFKISFFDSPNFLSEQDLQVDDHVLCIVDDFVGTGETVERAGQYLFGRGVKLDKLAVVSLVAMEQGVNDLQKKGYNIYVNVICRKGISDDSTFTANDVELMEAIEKRIRVFEEYKFGYQRSESLVKMRRTPNNTFPIYWLNNKKNKNAPFPR